MDVELPRIQCWAVMDGTYRAGLEMPPDPTEAQPTGTVRVAHPPPTQPSNDLHGRSHAGGWGKALVGASTPCPRVRGCRVSQPHYFASESFLGNDCCCRWTGVVFMSAGLVRGPRALARPHSTPTHDDAFAGRRALCRCSHRAVPPTFFSTNLEEARRANPRMGTGRVTFDRARDTRHRTCGSPRRVLLDGNPKTSAKF